MTQAITSTGTSFTSDLAELLLQVETNQSESARLQRDSARESYLENAQQQVEALHDAADATRAGAYTAAALSFASGAFSVGSASLNSTDGFDAKLLGSLAKTTGELAAPLKSLVGDSTAEDFRAQAKYFETRAEQAKWEASDASTAIDKAERRGDKVLDSLQGIQSDRNSANNTVIGRI